MITAKRIRVGILLLILGLVALDSWRTRVRITNWDSPLWLTLYPIAADGSEAAQKYVRPIRQWEFTGDRRSGV